MTFTVNASETQSQNPQPESDKAAVFIIEDLGQCVDCGDASPLRITDVSSAVIKVGADGSWIGAMRGNSYLFFRVAPGEHHFCVNWQSRIAERARAFAMSNLIAEAGKTYYLRARLFPGMGDFSFDLEAVNPDEGKYLVALSAFSVSHAKKGR